MKRIIALLMSAFLLFSLPAFAQDKINDSEQSFSFFDVYKYPIVPGTEAWRLLDGHDAMIEACQLPDEWLETDTASLLRCVLTYPLLIDVFVWSSFQEGVQEVSSYFNGMKELLSRDDLPQATRVMDLEAIDFSKDYQEYLARSFLSLLPAYISFSSTYTRNHALSGTRASEVTNNNVLTPNNTQVPHYENLTWYDHVMDQDDAEMKEYAVYVTYSLSPIYPMNPSYNCHSYAWHSSSTSNPYWIDDPSDYWEDNSFYRVYNMMFNYRIVYYRYDETNHYAHSGIVYSNSGLGVIESKWGYLGVYRHSLTNCPYYRSGGNTSLRYYTRDGE